MMFTDANNIAALVKRMEKNGLVERISATNVKRRKNITSTKLGTKKRLIAKCMATRLEKTALSGLSDAETSYLTSLLKEISTGLN